MMFALLISLILFSVAQHVVLAVLYSFSVSTNVTSALDVFLNDIKVKRVKGATYPYSGVGGVLISLP